MMSAVHLSSDRKYINNIQYTVHSRILQNNDFGSEFKIIFFKDLPQNTFTGIKVVF